MAGAYLKEYGRWLTASLSKDVYQKLTEIELCLDYTPLDTETVERSWDGSSAGDGSITCYLVGTKVYISSNSNGKIKLSNGMGAFTEFTGQSPLLKLKTIRGLSNLDLSETTSTDTMFFNLPELVDIDVSMLDVSNISVMKNMFRGCAKLTSLNVSGWNVQKVTNMQGIFQECSGLKSLDISRWDVSACTNMSFMFYGCSSLGEIDVSNWDTSNATNLDHFAAHANLKRKGMEKWNTSSLTNANAAFHNCAEEELDLSGWDVSKVQFFCQMFENSPNLKRIKGLEKWDTSAGLGFDGMFERCSKLEEVDLSSFDTSKAKNNVSASANGHKTATLQNMFLSCNNLKKVAIGKNFSVNGDGTNTTAGNKLVLPTPSTDYIASADGNWYAFNGEAYAPNAIKDRTAETYFASYALCADQDVIVKNGSLIDIAKAIREKNGETGRYTPAQFGTAIRSLANFELDESILG